MIVPQASIDIASKRATPALRNEEEILAGSKGNLTLAVEKVLTCVCIKEKRLGWESIAVIITGPFKHTNVISRKAVLDIVVCAR